MNLAEAEEIIANFEEWDSVSCSCNINPPCNKCINCPSPETYNEATAYTDAINNLDMESITNIIADKAMVKYKLNPAVYHFDPKIAIYGQYMEVVMAMGKRLKEEGKRS